jgi:hypothetical protein
VHGSVSVRYGVRKGAKGSGATGAELATYHLSQTPETIASPQPNMAGENSSRQATMVTAKKAGKYTNLY